MMNKIVSLALVLGLILGASSLLGACGTGSDSEEPATAVDNSVISSDEEMSSAVSETQELPEESQEESLVDASENEEESDLPDPIVTIEMEDGGIIKLKLLPEYAPNTVSNFITLAQSGFYDGLVFHRTIPTFMIQGGDPDGNGGGGPGYGVAGEFVNNGFTSNVISHTPGIISMARSAMPDSAGSQFFIVTGDATFLNKEYAAFGAVIEGMDVVEAIANTPTNEPSEADPEGSAPITPPVIKSITVDTKGVEPWPAPVTIPE